MEKPQPKLIHRLKRKTEYVINKNEISMKKNLLKYEFNLIFYNILRETIYIYLLNEAKLANIQNKLAFKY